MSDTFGFARIRAHENSQVNKIVVCTTGLFAWATKPRKPKLHSFLSAYVYCTFMESARAQELWLAPYKLYGNPQGDFPLTDVLPSIGPRATVTNLLR